MAGAGWYDDPLVPGGKRWWTGQAWTEEVRAPTEGGGWITEKVSEEPAPWVPGGAPRAAPKIIDAPAPAYSAIADWLRRSFNGLMGQLPSAVALFVVLPAGLSFAGYVALHTALSDSTFFFDEGRLEGFRTGPLIAAVVVMLIVVVGWLAALLGGLHFLTAVHRWPSEGTPPDPLRSLGIGVGRIPRLISAYLVIAVIMSAVAAVLFGLLVAAGRTELDDPLSGIPVIPTLVIGIPLGIWLLVKLAFVPVAVVAVPLGSSPLAASWRAGNERFVPLLLRLGVWILIVVAVAAPVQTFVRFVAGPMLASGVDIDALTGVTMNGRPLESAEPLEFSDLLRSPISAAPWLAMSALLNGAVLAVAASVLTSLWVDGEKRPASR